MPPGYRTVLVTGASRGIGAAVVERLCARGLDVVAVARNGDALAELAARTGCTPLVLDLMDVDAAHAALRDREIDVLVNNAGIVTKVRPLHEADRADLDRMLTVNLGAAIHLTHAVLGGMRARRRGHVIFVGSTAGRYVLPNLAVYGATKAALHHFARGLRYELAGTRVRVTEIAPGRVASDVYLEAMEGDRERMMAAFYDRVEALRPADVAQAIEAALDLPEGADAAYVELFPTDSAAGGGVYADRPPQSR